MQKTVTLHFEEPQNYLLEFAREQARKDGVSLEVWFKDRIAEQRWKHGAEPCADGWGYICDKSCPRLHTCTWNLP
jgi:hypothetical protein